MSSRQLTAVTVIVAAILAVLGISRIHFPAHHPPTPTIVLPHRSQSYLGVYAEGTPPSYQPVADFARAAGQKPNIVGYYSGWTEPFQISFAQRMHSHNIIPFVQIDPTLAVVSQIAAGNYDLYLRSYAASVRNYGHAVVIGFGHEMNAPTYGWGYGHVPPATFVKAWRHIVTLFARQGDRNVTWLWTIQADRKGTGPVSRWWPGRRYVSWVGIDGYYYRPSDTFSSVFGRTIGQVRKFTSDPVLLSETAVGPRAGQLTKISDLFSGMRQYGMLGLVWFDRSQHGGIYRQDWRIEDSHSAETAFQLGVSGLSLVEPKA
jgi:mannan endo-1,4-beta-mannosidase